MLDIQDVSLKADQNATFSHTFAAGEISVVLGANQSGKTDLCRLIAGLNTRATGKIHLEQKDISGVRVQDRSVALVYQAFVNYPNLTVFDNIASPLQVKNLSRQNIADRVMELAKKLQIETLLERMPNELSGGQQQRLAIARALAKDAQVLLLDEPLVNLDFKLREALEVELRDLLHAQNTVVIYTSSDPRDAFSLGDQVLLLKNGQKLQAGPPIEVYQHPRTFSAMSLLSDPQVNQFEHAGSRSALRPEHVRLMATGPGNATELAFAMAVTACETNGDESFIHGQVSGQDWVMRGRGMLDIRAGQVIQVCARPDDVVSF